MAFAAHPCERQKHFMSDALRGTHADDTVCHADEKPFSFEAALQSHVGTQDVGLMESMGFKGKLMLNSDASPDRPLLRVCDEDYSTFGGACRMSGFFPVPAATQSSTQAPHHLLMLQTCEGYRCVLAICGALSCSSFCSHHHHCDRSMTTDLDGQTLCTCTAQVSAKDACVLLTSGSDSLITGCRCCKLGTVEGAAQLKRSIHTC